MGAINRAYWPPSRGRRIVFAVMKTWLYLLLASTSALMTSCRDNPSTAVVVAIQSEAPVPDEVNELTIEVKQGNEDRYSEVYKVVPSRAQVDGPRTTELPGTITIYPSDPDEVGEPVLVRVRARLANGGGDRLVRQAQLRFVEEKQKLLRMPLRFACLDFPTVCGPDQTCKAGACVSDRVDLEQQPDFSETQVFARPGACFDREACGDAARTVPVAAAFAGLPEGDCTVPIAQLAAQVPESQGDRATVVARIQEGRFNFGFTWVANPTGKWTVVDQDEDDGWQFTDASRQSVRLSRGLCDVVQGKVKRPDGSAPFSKVILNTACEPKPPTQPSCVPAPASSASSAPPAPSP